MDMTLVTQMTTKNYCGTCYLQIRCHFILSFHLLTKFLASKTGKAAGLQVCGRGYNGSASGVDE